MIIRPDDPPVSSHLLKIKINTLRRKVQHNFISADEAVKELYLDCKMHENIYKKDLYKIFENEQVDSHPR